MELLSIIKSIIEEKKYDSLKKNINRIKPDELIKLRSHIVNEALKLRINALEKFYEIKNVNMKLPEKYRNLFFDKLFELKNNEINIPPEFVNEAASILNLEEELYLFDKSDLLNIFSTKDLNQNNIFNIIKYIVYNSFEDELYNRNDYILENVDYLSKKNEDNNKMFYPIIILDDECKHNIIYLLTYYYNLIESEIDVELTKFVIGNFSDQYRLYRNNLHKVKIEYPGLQIIENEMVCPLFEKLINLEAQLINKSILRYDILEFAQLRIKKQSSKELLLQFFEWDEISMIETEIENIILTLQKKEFKEKFNQEKRSSDEFSRDNKILIKEKEELKEQMKKRNTKKKKVLKGYENDKNRSSWDDVLIYYIESNDSFCYLLGNTKPPLNFSPTQKALLIIILNMNKDKPNLGYVHEKITFSRLNTSLKELFNKTQKPIEYNGHQRVFNIIVKISKIKNYTDFKTSTITEEMETKLVAKKDRELEDKYSDSFESEYDN